MNMDFKFDFPDPNTVHEHHHEPNGTDNCEITDLESCTNAYHIDLEWHDELLAKFESTAAHYVLGELQIKHLSSKDIHSYVKLNEEMQCFLASETEKSDILPGIYEGGLKIWECSLDLANYLYKNKCIKPNSRVFELGCGAGIPGILAYLSGARVVFQDFNSEVLKFVTMNNVMLNTSESERTNVSENCKFLSGDWKAIQNKFYGSDVKREDLCDVILTSETIYEKRNYLKLLELMKSSLKPSGIIYLAAKTHYFGVGGNLYDFELLIKNDNTFSVSEVHCVTKGVERKIIQMKFKNQESCNA